MLRQVHAIAGMRIHATDGDIGHVHDVYFDDQDWRVQYVHVDTRHWFGRHVLLAPAVVESVDWDGRRIHVAITREQVQNSADIDSHKPVSRQHGVSLDQYFDWQLASHSPLWEGEELAARLHKLLSEIDAQRAIHAEHETTSKQPNNDPRLWSVRGVHHYAVAGETTEIGRVDDLLIQPDSWRLRYIVVQKTGGLQVNRLLVPVESVKWISWDDKRIRVTLGDTANGAPHAHEGPH